MRYGVYGLGIVIGLLGLAAAFFGLDDPLIRSIGILMCLGGAYLLKISKAHGRNGDRNSLSKSSIPVSGSRPGRLTWVLGAASLAVSLGSFFLMNDDALHGYHHTWTLYAFVLSGTLFMVVSACIVAMLLWKLFKH